MPNDMSFSTLSNRVRGDVVTRKHPEWENARRGFHVLGNRNPRAVLFAESPQDIKATLDFARSHGLCVAPQSYGHQAMAFDTLDDAILLKTGRMRRVLVDPSARVARVDAGTPWGDVAEAAAAYHLTGLSGTSPDVGVIGYTLGGGLGWLGRQYGFACNSVLAIELVTGGGEFVRTDLGKEAELFWALRGGSGNFGVVTAMEFSLFPVREVYAGALFWPWEQGDRVFHRWRTWSLGLPETVTTLCRFIQLPESPEIPEQLRGRQFVEIEATCLGDSEYGDGILRELRDLGPELDTFTMRPPSRLSELHMDPREPVSARVSHQVLDDLPSDGIDALVTAAGTPSATPLIFFELRRLGGELAVARDTYGARAAISGPFLTFGIALAPDQEMEAAGRKHLQQFEKALSPWEAKERYLNFAEEPIDVHRLFDSETYARLQRAKAEWDPDGVIRSSHVISPGG